jgi:hypothetical protein
MTTRHVSAMDFVREMNNPVILRDNPQITRFHDIYMRYRNSDIMNQVYITQETYKLEEKVKDVTFIDRCCICLEDSDCMTECGHELCVICVKKVKKCPMCREELKCYYVIK